MRFGKDSKFCADAKNKNSFVLENTKLLAQCRFPNFKLQHDAFQTAEL